MRVHELHWLKFLRWRARRGDLSGRDDAVLSDERAAELRENVMDEVKRVERRRSIRERLRGKQDA